MTTPPQVPAALCGVFIGAKVVADDAKTAIGRVERADTEGALVWYVDRPAVTRPVRWLHLLLDSPLAMCHAARWLATRLGCDPGATAPWWTHYPRGVYCPGDNDPLRPDFWVLLCENGGCVWFVDADEPDDLKVDQDGNRYISVAGLKGSTLPAALAAACLAVGGAS